MSEPSLSQVMQYLESIEKRIQSIAESRENHLTPKEAAKCLKRGVSTIDGWKANNTVNRLGIPFTQDFHWFNRNGVTFVRDRCIAWMENDIDHAEEYMDWRKRYVKFQAKLQRSA